MRVIVNDASVLIDIIKVGILEAYSRANFTLVLPDVVLAEVKRGSNLDFEALGFQITGLALEQLHQHDNNAPRGQDLQGHLQTRGTHRPTKIIDHQPERLRRDVAEERGRSLEHLVKGSTRPVRLPVRSEQE